MPPSEFTYSSMTIEDVEPTFTDHEKQYLSQRIVGAYIAYITDKRTEERAHLWPAVQCTLAREEAEALCELNVRWNLPNVRHSMYDFLAVSASISSTGTQRRSFTRPGGGHRFRGGCRATSISQSMTRSRSAPLTFIDSFVGA